MAQINIHLTLDLERSLAELMRLRGIKTKSDAIRAAVQEAAERARDQRPAPDFRAWIGLATQAPLNPSPRFSSDDDLWGSP